MKFKVHKLSAKARVFKAIQWNSMELRNWFSMFGVVREDFF